MVAEGDDDSLTLSDAVATLRPSGPHAHFYAFSWDPLSFPATYVGFLFHEGRKMGRDLSFAFQQPSFPDAVESEGGT